MSSDIKLLPCPCCGSETKIGIIARKHFISYQAVCLECGLTAKASPTPELTAEKWNTRKPMDRIVELMDKALQDFSYGTSCGTCEFKDICDEGYEGCVETMCAVYKGIVKAGGINDNNRTGNH